ncbi:response regulator [bacterium]|nr:response regulator [bacterium]
MLLRLLLAIPKAEELTLVHSILDSALDLTCLDVAADEAQSEEALQSTLAEKRHDIVILDWDLAEAKTPALVRSMLRHNPQLRIVVLLPLSYRQYRQMVWDAGACNGIPREHMDQEWLSTVLCLMHRAMEREKRILATCQKEEVVYG